MKNPTGPVFMTFHTALEYTVNVQKGKHCLMFTVIS